MAENSKIEWTDHTFNPWIGCTKASDGCKNCYAEALMDKRYSKVQWGVQGKRVRTSATNWKKPLAWNKAQWWQCCECGARGANGKPFALWEYKCPECGSARTEETRARVFCASLADVFEDKPDQPEMDEWRESLFDLIELTPNLDWLLLTKRPENVLKMVPREWYPAYGWEDNLPSNVWIGTSVENQEQADKRIPELLKIPAAVRFLSMEPLLGAVDLAKAAYGEGLPRPPLGIMAGQLENPLFGIHWVIVGGESGANARPMHPDWVRSIRDQCVAAGVPFLFKQHGEWLHFSQGAKPGRRIHAWSKYPFDWSRRVGKHAAGRLLDGREWNEFPQVQYETI